jgi:hypothetical protein
LRPGVLIQAFLLRFLFARIALLNTMLVTTLQPVGEIMATEADTCRKFVVPKLQAAGWDSAPHSIAEQRSFTDGRIVVRGTKAQRKKGKRADYLLRYTRDFPIAVAEAKVEYKQAADGLQQAKDYAEILNLKFAYATNGKEIIEFDFITGIERIIETFPTPAELWARLRLGEKLTDDTVAARLLTPANLTTGKEPRYYQRIAIDRSVQAILQGRKRVLLTMATGTGKTVVAFQICWKLWSAKWNAKGDPTRKPRIFIWLTAISWWMIPKIKRSPPSVMRGTRLKGVWSSTAANFISRRINPSPRTSVGPVFTRNSHQTSSTSSSWTSAIAAAPRKIPTGAKYWNTSPPPTSLA